MTRTTPPARYIVAAHVQGAAIREVVRFGGSGSDERAALTHLMAFGIGVVWAPAGVLLGGWWLLTGRCPLPWVFHPSTSAVTWRPKPSLHLAYALAEKSRRYAEQLDDDD